MYRRLWPAAFMRAERAERHRAVLEVLGDPGRIVYVGGHGAGYTVKLLVNLLWFGQAVATAEALLLGQRAGIDPACCGMSWWAALRPAP
jgi:3-hydroxyisobutyrate dehydrogenase